MVTRVRACPRVIARPRALVRGGARAMMGGGRAGGRADDPSEAGARASTARRASREGGDDANAWMEMVRIVEFARGGRDDDARGRWARAMGRGCDPKVAQALTARWGRHAMESAVTDDDATFTLTNDTDGEVR